MIFENHTATTPAKRGALNWGTGIFLIIAHLAAIAALWFWSWPAVITALETTGYKGYVTFEYFHPYAHYPEALVYQTSDSLNRILGRV